jgi:gamma-glutamyltranspeptidase/glutathione hydrolase
MSTSSGRTGAVAAAHHLATAAAQTSFGHGGTAVDAAVTAAAVMTVVYPHNVTLGGDLFAVVAAPDGTVTAVNASGPALTGADAGELARRHGGAMPRKGVDSVTVPGGVRGWEALLQLGGRLPWADHFGPARLLAAHGFTVGRSLGRAIAGISPVGDQDEGFNRVFRTGGRGYEAGERLVQPALAATYATLAEDGPGAFYGGPIGAALVACLNRYGSGAAAADLAHFQAELTAPLAGSFAGHTVLTSPPNSQGFILPRALAAIEAAGLAQTAYGAGLAETLGFFGHGHHLRDTVLADPAQAPVDVAALVGGDLGRQGGGRPVSGHAQADGDTVGIAAADSEGWAVSLIQSVYSSFGAEIVDPATGIALQNRGNCFSLDPASPNLIAPGKRPAHTLMPALIQRDGRTTHVLATMGGQAQPQILAQVFLRLLAGESPAAAIAAPRIVIEPATPGEPGGLVTAEAGFDPAALAVARAAYRVTEVPAFTEAMGHTNVVTLASGVPAAAASDPRCDGAGVVVHVP